MGAGGWLALFAVFLGGVGIAVQAPVNATLGRGLGGTVTAAAISFGVGFVLLTVIALTREGLPQGAAMRAVPWWAWCGGALGAVYVWSAVWSVGRLGVVTMIAAVVLGQMVAALILDATGAFGLPVREIGWQRVAAIGLVASGLLLSRW